MAVTTDSRTAEADRAYDAWVRRGVPPKVVAALLPMLVGPTRTEQRAEWFLSKATVGHDLSPEGRAQDRALLSAARALMRDALESDDFAGHGSVFKPGSRYAASDEDIEARLDEAAPQADYPGAMANARRMAAAEATERMKAKHPRAQGLRVDEETGKVYSTDPTTMREQHIDTVAVPGDVKPSLNAEDPEPRPGIDFSNVAHYLDPTPNDGDYWGSGVSRPFFAD